MRILARIASVCSITVLTGMLGLSIFEWAGAARGTWRVVPVLSGSMAPLMPTGSAVIAWRTPMRELHVGSIVAYKIPVGDHHVEMHRVVKLKRTPDGVQIHTKGDANNGADPWVAKLTDKTYWRVGTDLPYLGWPIVYLQEPLFRLLMTFVAIGSFVLRRRADGGGGEVVDVEIAEAVVGALEAELEAERTRSREAVDVLARRLDSLQDEEAHRRRMHEVERVLGGLQLARFAADAVRDEPQTLVEVLGARVAEAGGSGIAAA
jgi:signal peptidase I